MYRNGSAPVGQQQPLRGIISWLAIIFRHGVMPLSFHLAITPSQRLCPPRYGVRRGHPGRPESWLSMIAHGVFSRHSIELLHLGVFRREQPHRITLGSICTYVEEFRKEQKKGPLHIHCKCTLIVLRRWSGSLWRRHRTWRGCNHGKQRKGLLNLSRPNCRVASASG